MAEPPWDASRDIPPSLRPSLDALLKRTLIVDYRTAFVSVVALCVATEHLVKAVQNLLVGTPTPIPIVPVHDCAKEHRRTGWINGFVACERAIPAAKYIEAEAVRELIPGAFWAAVLRRLDLRSV